MIVTFSIFFHLYLNIFFFAKEWINCYCDEASWIKSIILAKIWEKKCECVKDWKTHLFLIYETDNIFFFFPSKCRLEPDVQKRFIQLLAMEQDALRENRGKNDTYCEMIGEIRSGARQVTCAKRSRQEQITFENVNVSFSDFLK